MHVVWKIGAENRYQKNGLDFWRRFLNLVSLIIHGLLLIFSAFDSSVCQDFES